MKLVMKASTPRRPFALRLLLALLVTVPAIAFWSDASASARTLEFERVAGGLGDPVAMDHAGDDRLFVASQEGRIWIVRDGRRLATPFLDIRDRVLYSDEVSAEIGLLGLAFHPRFEENGYFFVVYNRRSDGAGVLARFSVSGPDPDQSVAGSERVLLVVPQPGDNHNVNHLDFGPDGYLYVSAGDGGYQPEPRCTPQEGDNLLGKILRLDVDAGAETSPFHSIPPDNPFVGDPSVRDEIWALGLRNPWRFAFDSETGDLWITDVGQDLRDEVDFVPGGLPGGQNWGWKMMEGTICRGSDANCTEPIPPCFDPAYSPPVLDNPHGAQLCAIIGGPVYRGAEIPEMRGALLVGDYCGATRLAHRRADGSFEFERLGNDLPLLVAFGQDPAGEAYFLRHDALFRITDLRENASVAFADSAPRVDESVGTATVAVRLERDPGNEAGGGPVSVTWESAPLSADEDDFRPADGVLTWDAGEDGETSFELEIFDDAELEGEERLRLALSDPQGAELGEPSVVELAIVDDEAVGLPCVASDTALCLRDERFRVSATWRDFAGEVGAGTAVPLTSVVPDSSGLLYFFGPDNPEILVKILDGCPINGHYWVFFSAATTVEYRVQILDTESGVVRVYANGLGENSPATTDTSAFACS